MAGQRSFVPVISVVTLIVLSGCGGAESEASAEVPTSEAPAPEATTPSVAASSAPAAGAEPTASETGRADGIPVGPAEGLIIGAPMEGGGVQVGAMDPDTAETWLISEFGVGTDLSPKLSDYPILLQDDFTRDFTRMAGWSNGNLGWFEDGGGFVDVTSSLPQDTGDFGREISYYSGWFDEEGSFHFGSGIHSSGTEQDIDQRYMVPAGGGAEDVKDMGAAPPPAKIGEEYCRVTIEGSLSLDDPWCTRIRADATGPTGPVSDWISDTEFIASGGGGESVYRDVTHDEIAYREEGGKRITPDVDRTIYSAVLSPDKSQVAFISPNEEGTKAIGLPPEHFEVFIVPADGSEEPRLVETLSFGNAESVRLIDWL